jgi:hypothetical protein
MLRQFQSRAVLPGPGAYQATRGSGPGCRFFGADHLGLSAILEVTSGHASGAGEWSPGQPHPWSCLVSSSARMCLQPITGYARPSGA